MINRVILVGRLTKDPILRKTQSGTSVVSFTLAVNRRIQNQEQTADFINCTAWSKTAELVSQYVFKGSQVAVEGRIQTGSYEGQDGKRVYTTDVVVENVQFLDAKGSGGNEQRGYEQQQQYGGYNNNNNNNNANTYTAGYVADEVPSYEEPSSNDTLDIASDDLPF